MTAEVPGWLEPYPDALLDSGPDARFPGGESVSLAFVAALQYLPPHQRAALILCDVLGFPVTEAAGILDSAGPAVAGALRQARAALAARLLDREPAPPPHSACEQRIAGEFSRAVERADIDAILALLTRDVRLVMPPRPVGYQGLAATRHLLSSIAFRGGRRYRLLPTRANRQPAFGCYLTDPRTPVPRAHGLLVLTLSGDRICALTRFTDNALLPRFGLPPTVPGWPAGG
jgi:RNA polymerase sigma-70 factor (ECF subfamily)